MQRKSDLLTRVLLGAAGGVAGTVAIQALLAANQKWLPETIPPVRQDPGDFMLNHAEALLPRSVQNRIPEALESGVAKGLGVGYGATFGALYAALRPQGGSPLVDGAVLGTLCWAAGYLGWLPALGLMPPVWKQHPAQAVAPVAEHLAYGAVAVAAYDWLQDHVLADA